MKPIGEYGQAVSFKDPITGKIVYRTPPEYDPSLFTPGRNVAPGRMGGSITSSEGLSLNSAGSLAPLVK